MVIGRILLVLLVALAARDELVLPPATAVAPPGADLGDRLGEAPVEAEGSGRLAETGERVPPSWSHEPAPGCVPAPGPQLAPPAEALRGSVPRSIAPRQALRASAAARAPPRSAAPVS